MLHDDASGGVYASLGMVAGASSEKLEAMARAEAQHDRIVHALQGALASALQGSGCVIVPQPCGVLLKAEAVCTLDEFNDHGAVRPDLAIVCDPSQITPEGVTGVPDHVVEVLTSDSLLRDTTRRLGLYERLQVKEYWIVDSMGLLVHTFRLNKENQMKLYQSAAPGEQLPSRALPGVAITAWDGWMEDEGGVSS